MVQTYHHHQSNLVKAVLWHGYVWLPPEFIHDATTDGSSRLNSEALKVVLFAQVQPNTARLIGGHFTVRTDNDPKHIMKATQDPLKANNMIFYSHLINY